MKRILIINLLVISLGFIGCASAGKMKQCQDDLRQLDTDLVTLKARVKQLDETLNKALKALEDMRFEIEVTRRELFALKGLGEKPLPNAEITQLINEIKGEEADLKEISEKFQKYDKAGLAALLYALKEPDLDFRKRVETVLEYLPSKDVVPVLSEALRAPTVRISATHILGNLNDSAAISALAEYINDDNPDFRLAIAEALVKLKDKRGIPALIEYLKSDNQGYRALAFDRLAKAIGQTFDYKHYAPESERMRAARQWETWWLRQSATFEFSRMEKPK